VAVLKKKEQRILGVKSTFSIGGEVGINLKASTLRI
jgi:hypothetical protein